MHLFSKSILQGFRIVHRNPRLIHSTCLRLSGSSFENITKQGNLTKDEMKEIEEEVKHETKNWVSHGFSYTDRSDDEFSWNWTLFWTISVGIVGVSFILFYSPDAGSRDWARREAYLELERRERDGLPLVDPNVVPLDRIKLPEEAELGHEFKPIV